MFLISNFWIGPAIRGENPFERSAPAAARITREQSHTALA